MQYEQTHLQHRCMQPSSRLAYDIDMSKTPEILGTIAGADTVFAVMREDLTREEAKNIFAKFLPLMVDEEGAVE